MKRRIALLGLSVGMLMGIAAGYNDYPKAAVSICALGEDQKPINAAEVSVSFEEQKIVWGGGAVVSKTGETNEKGYFKADGYSRDQLGFKVKKTGIIQVVDILDSQI